jgi:hypothetical protein
MRFCPGRGSALREIASNVQAKFFSSGQIAWQAQGQGQAQAQAQAQAVKAQGPQARAAHTRWRRSSNLGRGVAGSWQLAAASRQLGA